MIRQHRAKQKVMDLEVEQMPSWGNRSDTSWESLENVANQNTLVLAVPGSFCLCHCEGFPHFWPPAAIQACLLFYSGHKITQPPFKLQRPRLTLWSPATPNSTVCRSIPFYWFLNFLTVPLLWVLILILCDGILSLELITLFLLYLS